MGLKEDVENMRRELDELKNNRFYNLTSDDVENIKDVIFERQAVSLVSGASSRFDIVTIRGERRAFQSWDKFEAIA